jgi:hypothetical protein
VDFIGLTIILLTIIGVGIHGVIRTIHGRQ